jgi:uncharacterized integral membrane protein (TIGR00698 family)
MIKQIRFYIPGLLLSVVVAFIALYLNSITAQAIIGSGVYALFVGMVLHPLVKRFATFNKGISFSQKRLLRLAIIGMGFTLGLKEVLAIGAFSLVVMLFTLATAFGGGLLLGKVLKMPWRQSALISAGTGICGASAIAALAPVVNAKNEDIAYALSATFIFDVLMVLLFPIMGRLLQMSDIGYGLWTGTAVNDTSSVLAAGYAFSEAAGAFAIVVKLSRTLSIVPIVFFFSLFEMRSQAKLSGIKSESNFSVRSVFPYFVLLFFAVVVLNSLKLIPSFFVHPISVGGKFAMIVALGSIGLVTDAKHLVQSGLKPMFHGFVISAAVVIVSYTVQLFLNQI